MVHPSTRDVVNTATIESEIPVNPRSTSVTSSTQVNLSSDGNANAYHDDPAFRLAVEKAVEARISGSKSGVPVDIEHTKDAMGNTVWIYVNRNPFPVYLPDPKDPGSRVAFAPCPDKEYPLGRLDFQLNPFYANFVGYKSSITQEPAPRYLKLTQEDFVELSSDSETYDLLNMSPDKLADFLRNVASANPEMAAQISSALGQTTKRRAIVSQAPPMA